MITTDTTQRQQICIEAAYQADALLRMLLAAAHHDTVEELPYLLKGMVPRLLDLNDVLMSTHDADIDSAEGMLGRLHGGHATGMVHSKKGGAA